MATNEKTKSLFLRAVLRAMILVALLMAMAYEPTVHTYRWVRPPVPPAATVTHTSASVLIGTVRVYDNVWIAHHRAPTDIELGA